MEKSPVKEKRLYWKLFWATFQLSAFTFGGGYVIVPLMRRKFVMNLHWLEDDEMLDLTAIAPVYPWSYGGKRFGIGGVSGGRFARGLCHSAGHNFAALPHFVGDLPVLYPVP